MREIAFLELTEEQREDCEWKNRFLTETKVPFLGILHGDRIVKEQVQGLLDREQFLEEYGVIALCAGAAEEAMCLTLKEVLNCYTQDLVGLVFDRELLNRAGRYNPSLQGLTDFEFLCRLTESCGEVLIVMQEVPEEPLLISEKDLFTYTYLLRRYLRLLKQEGLMEGLLNDMYQLAQQCDMGQLFQQYLGGMLAENGTYEEVAWETAPYAVFRGDGTCYGVLQDFADCFIKGMLDLGHPVLALDAGLIDYDYLDSYPCRAFVGFQSAALGLEYFQRLKGIKAQFWLDNPVFYKDRFLTMPKETLLLCQDENYAEFIRQQYHLPNAIHFPPGGHEQSFDPRAERPLDIVFIGGYLPEADTKPEGFEKKYYDYLLQYPDRTFSQALREVSRQQGIELLEEELADKLTELKSVCQRIINHYRKAVIDVILSAGYEVHVYGDTWENYHSPWEGSLIKHPAVTVEESLEQWQKAKIGLNVMSWHKAGMTERVANVMLAGAACLTDETTYIKQHFIPEEEVSCFRLDRLEELPKQIEGLLQDDSWKKIAEKGQKRALEEHTWKHRTSQFEQISKKIKFSSSLFGESIR